MIVKYTIMGFNQAKAVELNLDTDDLLILSYFSDFRDTELMVCEKFDGKNYYWLKYEALLKNLPILRVKTNGALRKRLKKLQDAKILEHRCKKNKEGTYSFYGIGENYSLLKLSTLTEITVQKSPSNVVNNTTVIKSMVPTVTEISTGAYENHDGVLTEISTGAYENHDQNINLLKDSSIKNISLLENQSSIKKDLIEEDNKEFEEKVKRLKEETYGSFKYYDYKKLLRAANGDVDLVLYVYENTLNMVSDENPIKNLVAYMKKAIENELEE